MGKEGRSQILKEKWICFFFLLFGCPPTTLVEIAEDLATSAFTPGLLVIHDAGRGREYEVPELTRRKQVCDPLFNVLELDVKTGADDATLVETTYEIDNNLAAAVIVNDFELTNVTCG